MENGFYQDEFYLECPECGGELSKMGSNVVYCPDCEWIGKSWEVK